MHCVGNIVGIPIVHQGGKFTVRIQNLLDGFFITGYVDLLAGNTNTTLLLHL